MWMAQQVELPSSPAEEGRAARIGRGPLDGIPRTLRGYRILEELRTYPSVVYLERIRSSEV
jgi:hypothetical protein